MTNGPLKRLTHDYYFDDDGRGGTVIRDAFEFAVPFWVLGRVAEVLWLTSYFRRFLEVRNYELAAVATRPARADVMAAALCSSMSMTAPKSGGMLITIREFPLRRSGVAALSALES
jgi:hypothetical protein